jgi:hypothetical protein
VFQVANLIEVFQDQIQVQKVQKRLVSVLKVLKDQKDQKALMGQMLQETLWEQLI